VHFVDEEHVAVLELGENRRQVAGALERRARCDVDLCPHLVGDDARHGGLAQPGRAGEQEMVGGLVALARGTEHDREMLLQFFLADEVADAPRSQVAVGAHVGVVARRRVDELLTHGGPPRG